MLIKTNSIALLKNVRLNSYFSLLSSLKTLKLIKLARAALIYLSLAVHTEEYKRDQEKEAGKVMPTQLEKYDDDWKI